MSLPGVMSHMLFINPGGGGGGGGVVYGLGSASSYGFDHPAPPVALTFNPGGDYEFLDFGFATTANWRDPGGTGSDYEIMATVVSGTAPAGDALATWLSLGTARGWQLTGGLVILNIKIRLVATGVVKVERADCQIYSEDIGGF